MIKIEKLDHKGRGIAKLDNKIVFIENALPQEEVEIDIFSSKKNYSLANVKEIITPSLKRVKSPCKYFKICGGCDIMHMSYNDQLLFKENKVKEILHHYVDTNLKINKIVSSDLSLNYRNKTTFHIDKDLGLCKKNSNDLVFIDECLISNNKINNTIPYLKKLDFKNISKITVRGSNDIMVVIETTDSNLNIEHIKDIAASIYLKINDEYKLIYGKPYIYEKIGKYKYAISPNSFFQINNNVCFKLYSKINDYVKENKNVLDLYCGIGSIGIFVNEKNDIYGIEINKSAIKDANLNKNLNNIENINFICGDSGKSINNLKFNPDIIIVDPPRSGLNRETINNILKFKAMEIIYVSCDTMTFARDLNILKNYYKIIEVTPFDMFPNTSHVECIAYLKIKDV